MRAPKKITIPLFLMLSFSFFVTSCNSTPNTRPQASGNSISTNSASNTSVATPTTMQRPTTPRTPMRTVNGNGYTFEVAQSWSGLASLTAGQENVFTVDQYPGLPTNFSGARVLTTVFVNRFATSRSNLLNDFINRNNEFTIVEQSSSAGEYFLIMSRRDDRNSLRYTRLFYHPLLGQAISYSLTFRVIGNEQSFRNQHQIDPIAREILSFFSLV